MHVMLPVERSLADRANPLRLLLVNRALVSQQVRAQAERKPTLITTVRTLPVVHSSDMCFEMSLRLELESTADTWELPHFLMNDLLPTTCKQSSKSMSKVSTQKT